VGKKNNCDRLFGLPGCDDRSEKAAPVSGAAYQTNQTLRHSDFPIEILFEKKADPLDQINEGDCKLRGVIVQVKSSFFRMRAMRSAYAPNVI